LGAFFHDAEDLNMIDRELLANPSQIDQWEDHTAHEFVHMDVDATMRTMSAHPHVIHVPVATGGRGWKNVRDFYARYFIGRNPQDLRLEVLSRTADAERVVDEMLISFTHDVEMPAMLPGVAPTGRRVEIPLVAIVAFRDGKIESEHIYWDQASVLAQIGLLSSAGLPVQAAGQAKALLDPAAPLNELLEPAGQNA
jgi:carboxymethylenebutenolidase